MSLLDWVSMLGRVYALLICGLDWRAWQLTVGEGQTASCCAYEMPKHMIQFVKENNQVCLTIGQIWAVWPDWAIYWTSGNFLKHLATINLPNSLTFLGNFCKGFKINPFSSEIIFGQLLFTFGDFFLVILIVGLKWHCILRTAHFVYFAKTS